MGIVDKLFGNSELTKVERLQAKKKINKLWKIAKKIAPAGSIPSRRAYQARMALVKIGEPAVPKLIKALRRRDTVSRAITILCLMEERAVDHIVQILDDKDEYIRNVAKDILKSMHNAKAREAVTRTEGGIEALINKVKYGDTKTCIDAAEILAKTGDNRAIDAFICTLGNLGHDRKTRWILTKALADIGDERAIEPLERSLRVLSHLCALHPNYWQYINIGIIHPYLREELNKCLGLFKCDITISPRAEVTNEGGGRWEIKEGGLGIYEMKPGSEVAFDTGSNYEKSNEIDLFLTNKYPVFSYINDAIYRIKYQKR
jgi:hypothetical protein